MPIMASARPTKSEVSPRKVESPKAEETDKDRPSLTFVAIPVEGVTAAGDGQAAGEWDTPPDLLENQGLAVIEGEKVTQSKSHDDA